MALHLQLRAQYRWLLRMHLFICIILNTRGCLSSVNYLCQQIKICSIVDGLVPGCSMLVHLPAFGKLLSCFH